MTYIDIAIALAKEKHKSQYRANGKPYIIHCLEVYKMMRNFTDKEHVLVAAILHDLIEDTGVKKYQIAETFGEETAELVWEVTKDEKGNFSNLNSRDAKLIKLCDRLQNLSDCDEWLEKNCYRYIGDTRVLLIEHYFDK